MTPEQNKNYIFNNLDKYIIDGKGSFINLEKDYNDSDYIIWKTEVKDYEELREKVVQAIIKDKNKWKLISNKEIIEDIMEAILLEKENWEIVYGWIGPKKYRHRPSGAEIEVSMCDTFTFEQAYILLGELGYRGPGNDEYDKWGHYRLEEWWERRNYKKQQKLNPTNPVPQPEPTQPQTEEQKDYEKSFEEAKNQAESQAQNPSEPQNQVPKKGNENLNNIENSENQETEKSYNDNKEQIENLEREKAAKNPQQYGEDAKKRIEEKLESNGIKENELSNEEQQEWQKLKNGEIKDPNQLVAVETKIKQNIYQEEAKKKIIDFTSRVNQVLKSKLKSSITTLKKELLAFVSSSNIYYTPHKKEIENLLAKLENYANSNNTTSTPSSSTPWKIIIPLLVIGTLLLVGAMILRTKRIARKKT